MAELKKYYADNHNALLLENIMQFAANINLKDKDAEDAAETDQSRFFKDILKKYYEDRLNFFDIVSLKKFVDKYNAEAKLTAESTFRDKTINELLAEIFKLSIQTIDDGTYLYDISIDKKNSFLTNLYTYTNSLLDAEKQKAELETVDDEQEESEPEVEQSIKEFENEKDYSRELIDFINYTIIDGPNHSTKVMDLCTIIIYNMNIQYPENITQEKLDIIKASIILALTKVIKNYIRVYLLNYFIQFSIDFYTIGGVESNILNVTVNKDSPDQYEKDDIANEYSVASIITAFDLDADYRINVANQYFNIQDNMLTLNNTYGIRFSVVYKELNPYRREISSASLFESALSTILLKEYDGDVSINHYAGLLDNILFTWRKE